MPVSTSSSTCGAPEDAGCYGEHSEKARLTGPKGMGLLTPEEELSVEPGTKCTFQVSVNSGRKVGGGMPACLSIACQVPTPTHRLNVSNESNVSMVILDLRCIG